MTTVEKLPDKYRNPMLDEANHGLMVHWINRAGAYDNDVRNSIVFYTEDGMFKEAVPGWFADVALAPEMLQKLYDTTTVRYYSLGVGRHAK